MAALLAKEESDNSSHLREDKGTHLTSTLKKKLNELLFQFQTSFSVEGEASPFIEHHFDTQNHPLASVPPYQVIPARKEIDRLLTEGIIEPRESPYAAPVVLIPKPNGTYCFYVDYRKLNTIIKIFLPITTD